MKDATARPYSGGWKRVERLELELKAAREAAARECLGTIFTEDHRRLDKAPLPPCLTRRIMRLHALGSEVERAVCHGTRGQAYDAVQALRESISALIHVVGQC